MKKHLVLNILLTPILGISQVLNSNNTVNRDISFTNSKRFDGKYGTIDNNVSSTNVSFSSPFIPEKSFWKPPILSPIPYAGVSFFDRNKPR
jgi:hypothetical protein